MTGLYLQVRSLPHMPGVLDSYKEEAARVSSFFIYKNEVLVMEMEMEMEYWTPTKSISS